MRVRLPGRAARVRRRRQRAGALGRHDDAYFGVVWRRSVSTHRVASSVRDSREVPRGGDRRIQRRDPHRRARSRGVPPGAEGAAALFSGSPFRDLGSAQTQDPRAGERRLLRGPGDAPPADALLESLGMCAHVDGRERQRKRRERLARLVRGVGDDGGLDADQPVLASRVVRDVRAARQARFGKRFELGRARQRAEKHVPVVHGGPGWGRRRRVSVRKAHEQQSRVLVLPLCQRQRAEV